jgi:DNA/RNA-binding domain of Phe-tRNA-synthetase-like protein
MRTTRDNRFYRNGRRDWQDFWCAVMEMSHFRDDVRSKISEKAQNVAAIAEISLI